MHFTYLILWITCGAVAEYQRPHLRARKARSWHKLLCYREWYCKSVELGAEDEAVAAVIDCPDLWLAGSVIAFGMVDDVEQAAFEGAEEHAVT